jgi:hypothetical protein
MGYLPNKQTSVQKHTSGVILGQISAVRSEKRGGLPAPRLFGNEFSLWMKSFSGSAPGELWKNGGLPRQFPAYPIQMALDL